MGHELGESKMIGSDSAESDYWANTNYEYGSACRRTIYKMGHELGESKMIGSDS